MKLIQEKKINLSTVAITLVGLIVIGLLLSAPSSIAGVGRALHIEIARSLQR